MDDGLLAESCRDEQPVVVITTFLPRIGRRDLAAGDRFTDESVSQNIPRYISDNNCEL